MTASANSSGGGEPDLSWFDIAVDRNGNVWVLDYSPGWSDPSFFIEPHWDDTFAIDPPSHLAAGAYRWSGFNVGFWAEDDAINVTGGEFVKHALAQVQP